MSRFLFIYAEIFLSDRKDIKHPSGRWESNRAGPLSGPSCARCRGVQQTASLFVGVRLESRHSWGAALALANCYRLSQMKTQKLN